MSTKRLILVHGWEDSSSKDWLGFIKRKLPNRVIRVIVSQMKNPKEPNLGLWVDNLKNVTRTLTPSTVLLGHSLGCAVILRFLSNYHPFTPIAGLVLVAGFIDSIHKSTNILFEPVLDFKKIMAMSAKRICIYSDDDPLIAMSRSRKLAQAINAVEQLDQGRGHFSNMKEVSELPSVKQAIKSCFQDLDKPVS